MSRMLNQDTPADIQSFVASMLRDPSIRQAWLDDPNGAAERMRAQGADWLPDGGAEIKVVCNTADTFYLTLPSIGESEDAGAVSDAQLAFVQGGVRAGSAGTAACGGSASTAGSLNTTLSTGGSASSLSTAGTAAP